MSDASIVFSHPTTPLTVAEAPFDLTGLSESGRQWRRRTAQGPYMHGRKILGAVLDTPTLTVTVRVFGATWADVRANVALVEDVTAQLEYTATVTILGVARVYTCEPADIVEVGPDRGRLAARVTDLTLSIPVQPF